MTVLSRMLRLCKADLHGVMDQIEDKGLLLKQYLREMECALKEKQARRMELTRAGRQLQGDLDRHQAELEKLEADLALALRKEKDDIARMLIRKRRLLQSGCDAMARQMRRIAEEEAQLAEILSRQEIQYREMKARAAEYGRWSEQRPFSDAAEETGGPGFSAHPTDEEIEIELLQRKDAMKQGGEA